MEGPSNLHALRHESRSTVAVVFSLFVVSGFTGLAYEVIWARMLVRVLGATTLAVTTVLASYMAGLALGSIIFGRVVDRRGNPIRIYGFLELGIGLFALVFPYLITLVNPFYRAVYPALQGSFYLLSAVRFALCFAILLIPTILMGGTLPVLSKFVAEGLSSLTRRVGRLYAVNTFGAVVGAFATGFLILPRLGMRNTTWLAAVLNGLIVIVALLLARGPTTAHDAGAEASGETYRPRRSPGRSRLLLAVFASTGFCALAVEVVWTRMLALVVGTTVYAFALMLTTFLLGLALGSAAFARVAQGSRRPGLIMGLVVCLIGLSIAAGLVAFGNLPIIYMSLYQRIDLTWTSLSWLEFMLCALIMLGPTFLMGGLFPLVARLYARDIDRVGREIGTMYAFNTIGAILGSFAGSFFFLRYLGIVDSLALISAVYMGLGLSLIHI